MGRLMRDEQHDVPGYCALCVSACGCTVTVHDDELVDIRPDPGHPTGTALCPKGRASLQLVDDGERLLRPLRRTRPKDADDPGWEPVSWDRALDEIAGRLRAIRSESGAEAVTFGAATPSGTSVVDAFPWIERLARLFGTPNLLSSLEVCNWHSDEAYAFTFGVGFQGTPDVERSGCILLWGHSPRTSWLARMTRIVEAVRRGAALIVVDPRREGLAKRADAWLRVRPGADAAVALALAGELLRIGGHDEKFLRTCTNAGALVRGDDGRLLRPRDIGRHTTGSLDWTVVDRRTGAVAPAADVPPEHLDLTEPVVVRVDGREVRCRPAFALFADRCAAWPPERAGDVAWVDPDALRQAAELLATRRPVAHASWSGVNQGTNVTGTARAVACLYALTGDYDAPGGNVFFPGVPQESPFGWGLLPPEQRARALGRERRPLGPAADGAVSAPDLWTSVLDGDPYRTRALVSFGMNPITSHADPRRAAAALRRLEFHVHADLYPTPTSRYADLVLPVCTPWEREALRCGFPVDAEGWRTVQWRPRMVAPRGESRADLDIVCALAGRLGLQNVLGGGSATELFDRRLAPAGLSVEALAAAPGHRVTVRAETVHRKHLRQREDGTPRGFPTPSRRVELYSERLLEAGGDPLPDHHEPAVGTPDGRYPLVLTCAKVPQYCLSQHRSVPALRGSAPHPTVTLHPDTAARRGIRAGDWVQVVTDSGRARACARFDPHLDERVACGTFGWWQACPPLGAAGHDPLAEDGDCANYALLIGAAARDPVSGSVPLRQYRCEVRRLSDADGAEA